MTERERFMARFAKEKSEGLVDMKFLVRDGSSLSPEDFYGALNRVDRAIEKGQCERHSRWEADYPAKKSQLLEA